MNLENVLTFVMDPSCDVSNTHQWALPHTLRIIIKIITNIELF